MAKNNWKLEMVLTHPNMSLDAKIAAIVEMVGDELEGTGFNVSEKNWLSVNGEIFGKKVSLGGAITTSANNKKYGKLCHMSQNKKKSQNTNEQPSDKPQGKEY